MTREPTAPRWMFQALMAAAVYNVVWGAFAVLAPFAVFDALDIDRPRYAELWQCIGMIVGVYGLGYGVAAFRPYRHWPIVLVGFLGKIFGPIGFAKALWAGSFPLRFGWILVFNDLIWWVPFFLILRGAWKHHLESFLIGAEDVASALKRFKPQGGDTSLWDLSFRKPLFVVFLRHKGCTFCRETLHDLKDLEGEIRDSGHELVLVHMSQPDAGLELAISYDLRSPTLVSDPEQSLYRAFGLGRGSLTQTFGLAAWKRGFIAGVLNRHGVGRLDGDGFQMPGLFVIDRGRVRKEFRHISVADRPNYRAFLAGEPSDRSGN